MINTSESEIDVLALPVPYEMATRELASIIRNDALDLTEFLGRIFP